MCVQLSADTRSRRLRSAARNDLLIPRTRTASYGPRSFAVSGPTCWNCLPPQLKSASLTLQQFCYRLKTVSLLFFRIAARERCRHDFVIRSRGHKSILQLHGFYSISNYRKPENRVYRPGIWLGGENISAKIFFTLLCTRGMKKSRFSTNRLSRSRIR